MDPFAAIVLGGLAGLVLALLLLARPAPRPGAEQLGRGPGRAPGVLVQAEHDDLDQLLEATNRRRRRRGEAELTEDGVRAAVAAGVRAAPVRRPGVRGDGA